MTIEWKKCQTCKGQYMAFARPLFHRVDDGLCDDCHAMSGESGEVESGRSIRCPSCKQSRRVECEDGLYEEGEHTVCCPDCDHEYPVRTEVSYTFVSPAMGVIKAEELE